MLHELLDWFLAVCYLLVPWLAFDWFLDRGHRSRLPRRVDRR